MPPVNVPPRYASAGRIGLYLFAFSLWLSTAGAYIGLGLMLLASVADPGIRNSLRRDPMLKLALLFAGLLLLHALWAASTTTESYAVLWDDAWKWLRLFLFFIFVACWLGGDERYIGRAFLLTLAGLLLKILLGIQAAGLPVLWKSEYHSPATCGVTACVNLFQSARMNFPFTVTSETRSSIDEKPISYSR